MIDGTEFGQWDTFVSLVQSSKSQHNILFYYFYNNILPYKTFIIYYILESQSDVDMRALYFI